MAPGRTSSIGELAAVDSSIHLNGDPETIVNSIESDVREVRPGSLFVSLPAKRFSGSAFVPEAIDRGACAILSETPIGLGIPELTTSNIQTAFPKVAAAHFGYPSTELSVIGITGTDGKTSTTYMTDSILRAAGQITGYTSTVSIRVGDEVIPNSTHRTTPESSFIQGFLREVADKGGSSAILEATSQGLDVHRLDEVKFRIGAVTNITREHQEQHKTMAAYTRAKGILFQRVGEIGGVSVINVDDPGACEMLKYARSSRVIRYGINTMQADVRANVVELGTSGTEFELQAAGNATTRIRLPLPGLHNVYNALCAASIAIAANVPIAAIVKGLESATAPDGRMTQVDAGQPFSVYVDFAHTPAGVETVLKHLRTVHPHARIILLIGGAGDSMIALPDFGKIATHHADFGVFTTDNPNEVDPNVLVSKIADGAMAAGAEPGISFTCIADRRNAIFHALSMARPGDAVLMAGIGPSTSLRWGDAYLPWNEVEVAAEALRLLGYDPDNNDRTRPLSRPPGNDPMTPGGDGFALSVNNVFHGSQGVWSEKAASPNIRSVIMTGTIAKARDLRSITQVPVHTKLKSADLAIFSLTGTETPVAPTSIAVGQPNTVEITSDTGGQYFRNGDEIYPKAFPHLSGLEIAPENQLVVQEVRGLRFGIVTFDGVSSSFDVPVMHHILSRSRPLVDVLIVVFHWGEQSGSVPQPLPGHVVDDPREIARIAIDCDVDLVLGNHPHWVQGIDFHSNKLIAYSHGSLLPGERANGEVCQGIIGRYTFNDTDLVRVEYLPLEFDERGQPNCASEARATYILRTMEASSLILELGL